MTFHSWQGIVTVLFLAAACLAAIYLLRRRPRAGVIRLAHRQGSSPEAAAAAQPTPPSADAIQGAIESAASRCLYAIAQICNRDDIEIGAALAQIAELLPSMTSQPQLGACRIEFRGSFYWSPAYRASATFVERPVRINGSDAGLILLGVPTQDALDATAAVLEEAAHFTGQMLARRIGLQQIEEQTSELKRRQSILKQTARLAKLGSWEFDVATSSFTWSEEIRQIAGWRMEDAQTAAEETALVAGFLRHAIDEALKTYKPLNRELPYFHAESGKRWLQAIGEVEVVEGKPARVLGILRDITDERETQNRLVKMANHDALTGLANRRHFVETLEAALLTRGAAGALLMIDLDNFKDVNDTGGHDLGDALLKAFARRLEEFACGCTVARLGGDEFAVLMPDNNVSHAEHRAHLLLTRLREPLLVFGRPETVRISAGLTTFPADGRDATELMKNADLATYQAKAQGRNSLINYRRQIRQESEQRVAVCAEVEKALADNQFVPYYQPKVCLRTGAVVGFEALLRWNHPTGLRTPAAVLPAFDVPDLSRAICSRMLDRIVFDMANWQAQRLPFGRIALNASSAEFHGFDLADRVLRRLRSIGLPPSVLGVEVTETVFLQRDTDSIGVALKQLHDAGIEIALDDFGTGFASLTHLQKFPVDVIKIDQSFVRTMLTDSGSQAITSVVLGLGRSLGMKVVAEGVEKIEQLHLLEAGGCDQVQGYYFARPMPASEVPGFVSNWQRADEATGTAQKAA